MRLPGAFGERLARTSALALSADLIGKLGTLLLTLGTARMLSVHGFAHLAVCLALIGLLTAAFDGGAQTLMTRDGALVPERRRGLLVALALGRLPFVVVAALVAVAVGSVALGQSALLAAIGIAVGAAAAQSLSGVCRSGEQMRPERNARAALALLQLLAVALAWMLGLGADGLLGLLIVAQTIALAPLLRPARRLLVSGTRERVWPTVRRAAPFGAMTLATIVFYRAGTLVLGIVSTARETAVFTVASNLGFGLLMLPNAITTGLLPRLSSTRSSDERAATVRRGLIWTLAITVPAALATSLLCPLLLPLAFGRVYGAAAVPLALLSLSVLLIAVSGIAGTVLIVCCRLRMLAVQIAASLTTNLLALLVLAPGLGATGAALATVICETVGVALLVPAALRALPELRRMPERHGPVGAAGALFS